MTNREINISSHSYNKRFEGMNSNPVKELGWYGTHA